MWQLRTVMLASVNAFQVTYFVRLLETMRKNPNYFHRRYYGISEALKMKIKDKANFTCCWCTDPRNKVEVHHIMPEAKNGLRH